MCPKDCNLEHVEQVLNSYFLLALGNFEIKALYRYRALIGVWFILAQATSTANSDDSWTVSYHSNPLATMVISSRSSESAIHLLPLSHLLPTSLTMCSAETDALCKQALGTFSQYAGDPSEMHRACTKPQTIHRQASDNLRLWKYT